MRLKVRVHSFLATLHANAAAHHIGELNKIATIKMLEDSLYRLRDAMAVADIDDFERHKEKAIEINEQINVLRGRKRKVITYQTK